LQANDKPQSCHPSEQRPDNRRDDAVEKDIEDNNGLGRQEEQAAHAGILVCSGQEYRSSLAPEFERGVNYGSGAPRDDRYASSSSACRRRRPSLLKTLETGAFGHVTKSGDPDMTDRFPAGLVHPGQSAGQISQWPILNRRSILRAASTRGYASPPSAATART